MYLLSLIFKEFITILQNKLGQWDYHIFLAREPFCFTQETELYIVYFTSSILVTTKQTRMESVTLKETLKALPICRLTWEI